MPAPSRPLFPGRSPVQRWPGSLPLAGSWELGAEWCCGLGRLSCALGHKPPLTVSSIAGSAEWVRLGIRTASLGSPEAQARGAGMSQSRRRGAPEPEPRGAF